MIRLLIIILAFLLMLGAVIGGLYFWGIDPLARLESLMGMGPPKDLNEPDPSVKAPAFVDFGLLLVPLIHDREVKGRAEMIIRLRVNHDKRVKVAQDLPRLQQAFLQEMMSFLPLYLRENGELISPVVSRRLVRIAEKTIGPGMVLDVVIEQAAVK